MKTKRIRLVLIFFLALLESVQAGPEDVRPLKASTGLKPFAYTNAPEVMPNYLPGERWGTQGQPITKMQMPLPPEESAKHLVAQPGFQIDLWAAEPDIRKPIALAWDERGRLWIAETVDYPNDLQPVGQGNDRIKICEDTDGDGRADRFRVFAEDLSIPTSLCFSEGGLIVFDRGRTLFLKDTDGDDKADERRVLFEGWGMNDTHATASNMRYGLDNWIWGTVGYSGFNGEVGGESLRFGMGVFRFKPDGSKLEFVRSSNNNTWGLGLTEDGTVLGSTANGNASFYMAIPNRFYESVAGWSAARMETIADSQSIYPITRNVRQVDWHDQYTAGAGHALYTARAFPKEYWNRIAFVAEPTGHLLGFFRIDAAGADYRAINLGSFLASDDEWSSPIVAEVGPDGALWVIDWYNYIIQHNPTPIGFKTGQGNAYATTLRDKTHGRIYRVTHSRGTPTRAPRLDPASPATLVRALENDNQLWRLHAQRLLVQRGQTDVVPSLVKLARNSRADALGLNTTALHALWTLHGLGALTNHANAREAARRALKHRAVSVRRAAVQVLPRDESFPEALGESEALADSDPQVRLAAFLALAESPSSSEAAHLIFHALEDPANTEDRWLKDAATSAAARHVDGFLSALFSHKKSPPLSAREVIQIVARHLANQAPTNAPDLIAKARQTSPASAESFLAGLVSGWPENRPPALNDQDRARVQETLPLLSERGQDQLLLLARQWGQLSLFPAQLEAAVSRLKGQIADPAAHDDLRIEAARMLINLLDGLDQVTAILDQINLQASPQLAVGLIRALADSRSPETGQALLDRWLQLTPAQKSAALSTLLRRGAWADLVLNQLESGAIHPNDLNGGHWQILRNNPDRSLARRARESTNLKTSLSADREELVKQFLPIADRKGDAAHGREVYQTQCAVCHLFYGNGGKVGPDLSGIAARPRSDILTEILDPNRSVESNYRLWTITTKSEEILSGRLDAETQTSVELYDLTGQKHVVQRKDIANLEASQLSIMPTGFEALGETDMTDLLEFLATAGTP